MSDFGTLGQHSVPDGVLDTATLGPRLFLVLECDRPLAASMSISLASFRKVGIGRGDKRELIDSPEWLLRVPDRRLSSRHARLENRDGRWTLSDEGSKNGCIVNGVSTQSRVLEDRDVLELGRTFFVFRSQVSVGHRPVINLEDCRQAELPLTLNPELSDEIAKLDKLATTGLPILILGESGSGKEVVAQRIHSQSLRDGAFVPVNCGALPSGLVESELFGHKKGAFSGATDNHTGLVTSSDRGTLFLDEIADLPAASQAKMLRVLQEKNVRAVGASKSHDVDLRTVSATHFDLDQRVAEGHFRSDLYARIAGYRISIPPLRDRPEDLGLLIAGFLAQDNAQQVRFALETARCLLSYAWPLNIRELRSCLASARALAGEDCIELAHLPETLREARSQSANSVGLGAGIPRAETAPVSTDSTDKDVRRKARLEALLLQHQGNMSAVAREMKKDRKQIQRWIRRYEIDIDRFRGE